MRFLQKKLAGAAGFEPAIQAPKARALPLGHAPASRNQRIKLNPNCQEYFVRKLYSDFMGAD